MGPNTGFSVKAEALVLELWELLSSWVLMFVRGGRRCVRRRGVGILSKSGMSLGCDPLVLSRGGLRDRTEGVWFVATPSFGTYVNSGTCGTTVGGAKIG